MNIEVRVLRDCGDIVTNTGVLRLKKDTIHYVLRSDVNILKIDTF